MATHNAAFSPVGGLAVEVAVSSSCSDCRRRPILTAARHRILTPPT